MEMTLRPDGRFWDKIADRYAKRPIADVEAYRRKLEKTAEFLRPNMRLLELGCGTGGTALHHAKHVSEVHAVDISPRMIELAERKRQEAEIANVRYCVGELHAFVPGSQRYDAVLAMSLLHLVPDRDIALAKIRSLLQPGDLFVSSTMCMGDDLKLFRFIAPVGKALGLFPTVRVFSTEELRTSIETAGFDIVHSWKPRPRAATFFVAKAR
ncbi:MAG: class I SAM-dependent methyltransferase [Pseudomonadota bacterium]